MPSIFLKETWKKARLGDLCEITRGSSPRPIADKRYFEGGNIPWIKIADATKSGKYLYETKEHVNEYGASFSRRLPAGSLIIAASGTLGYPQLLGIEGCTHDGWLIISNFSGIDKNYLYYLFLWKKAFFYSSAYGAAIQNINTMILRDMEIKIPGLIMQKKIAATLSTYDDLIENNVQRMKLLEKMAQTIYREWFINFRFPGHEKTKFVDSPMGKIPDGWGIRKISDISTLFRGKSYRSSELSSDAGLPFINLKCIERGGGFRNDGMKRFIGDYKEANTCRTNDVVIAITDMTQERRLVGHAARIPRLPSPFGVTSMDLVRIAPKGDISSHFLYGLLRFSDFPDNVSQHANGVNVLHLSPAVIENYEIIIPPYGLTKRYGEFGELIYGLMDALQEKNVILRIARDLLLPRLISGEVDVERLEIEI